ncbi:MAG: hypothetical protein Q7R52_03225 [archaeon]|nr:hypothetical protein [archaeon]
MEQLQVGDLVLCTVDRIVGTIVFVKIEGNGEGSIGTSEIAPGRIRNLRDYVVPNKRIVCKVLRITQERNIELTLRRVSSKEKKEVMDRYSQEKKIISILKSILGEKAQETIDKISKKENLVDFFEEVKENPKKLEEFVGKDSEKILGILNLEKKKKTTIKKEICLKSTRPNGLKLIKEILDDKNVTIKYISAGVYSIELESSDLKKADQKLQEVIREIEKSAKARNVEFSLKTK